MKSIPIIFCLIALGATLPSTFDIRYQPKVAKLSNFESSPDTICEAYGWGKQLAQIFSNQVSAEMRESITLSGQQLADCVSSEGDKCKDATLKNLNDAIQYIQIHGLAEEYCYKNNFMELPNEFCQRKCTNGDSIPRTFKGIVTEESDSLKLLESIGNGYASGFAVVKIYERMNYYSPDHQDNMSNEGEFYSYGIAEIVGWRKKGEEVSLRMGAPGWGFKGYGFVSRNSPILHKFYSIKMLGYHMETKME